MVNLMTAIFAIITGGALALVIIHQVIARSSILARIRRTVVIEDITGLVAEARDTAALEIIEEIGAGSSIHTRIGGTVVGDGLTKIARITRNTFTSEGIHLGDTDGTVLTRI